jgi:hypothetical protein
VGIFQNFVVPKSQNNKSLMSQPRVTLSIISHLLGMLSSIHFNDHSFFQADEVHNITSQWLLPPKFVATQLPQPQLTPQESLSIRGVIA